MQKSRDESFLWHVARKLLMSSCPPNCCKHLIYQGRWIGLPWSTHGASIQSLWLGYESLYLNSYLLTTPDGNKQWHEIHSGSRTTDFIMCTIFTPKGTWTSRKEGDQMVLFGFFSRLPTNKFLLKNLVTCHAPLHKHQYHISILHHHHSDHDNRHASCWVSRSDFGPDAWPVVVAAHNKAD